LWNGDIHASDLRDIAKSNYPFQTERMVLMEMSFFGWVGSALFTLCYGPQIYQTYRTKQVHDVSLVMWLIQWVAYSSCLVYAVSIDAQPMIIGYSLGWLMTAWWLELYRQYRHISIWITTQIGVGD
jgi:uncharacterized protein with PQ loop repeat